MSSVNAVVTARLRTRALGDALEVNCGSMTRVLGCASTAAHGRIIISQATPSGARQCCHNQPSVVPVDQGRSFHRTVEVEGQPWVPVGSLVGPRFWAGIRGSPQKIRLLWVPVALCQKFGNTDYFFKLRAKAICPGSTKLWEAAQSSGKNM